MSWTRRCASAADTQRAGEEFARLLQPGDIVLLSGPLGAGKTTFTQGVARGLGVSDRVTSPTFTMVRQHVASNTQGITTLHHCDVYRVESLGEVLDLDLGELVEEDAVALVEWGELAASLFGRDVVTVQIDPALGSDERELRLAGAATAGRETQLAWWCNQ